MFDFSGKVILITGASYGLGEEFAYAFAEAGGDLILTARSTELLEAVGEKCRDRGSKVTVVTGDVSVEADVKRVIEQGIEQHGKIDVLINPLLNDTFDVCLNRNVTCYNRHLTAFIAAFFAHGF